MRFFFLCCTAVLSLSSSPDSNDSLSTAMAASVAERLWEYNSSRDATVSGGDATRVGVTRVLMRLAGGHSTVAVPGSQGGIGREGAAPTSSRDGVEGVGTLLCKGAADGSIAGGTYTSPNSPAANRMMEM